MAKKKKAPAKAEKATPEKKQVAPGSQKIRRPDPAPKVSHNVSMLEWPTDIWGLTKDLKSALTYIASRINGQPDKKELVSKVLEIGTAHIEAKYALESEQRAARIAKEAEKNELF